MPSLNNVSLDFKVFDRPSKEEKITQFKMLMKDPEVQPFFRNYIENIIATSELNILKRLTALEKLLGTNDLLDFADEDHEQTIPEQLSLLAERIDNITEPVASQDPIKPAVNTNPKTTLEHKASALVEHLKANVKPRNGEVFLNSKEIINFLKCEISEQYRTVTDTNMRRVKKDVIAKAMKLFPETVFISKAKHGKKEIRVVYRPYGNVRTIQK